MRIPQITNKFNPLCLQRKNVSCSTQSSPQDRIDKSSPSFSALTKTYLFNQALNIRNINNLPCAYSGSPMISLNTYKKMSSRWPKDYSLNKSLVRLSKFKNNMEKTERAIFNRILNTPAARSANDLYQAMVILRSEHLKRLSRIQLKVFKNINKLAENLSPEDRLLVKIPTDEAIDRILKNNPKCVFKRKNTIDRFEKGLLLAKDKETFKKILVEAYKLPTSSNNQYAFIAKYSGEGRSPEEIEERFLKPSNSSFDHKKPQALGGENIAENVIIVKSKLNSEKADAEPEEWIVDNEIKVSKNAQKQIDYLIHLNNKGYKKKIAWYILCLKNSIFDSSRGLINPDISKLKIDKKNAKTIRYIQKKFPETFGNRDDAEIEGFIQQHYVEN